MTLRAPYLSTLSDAQTTRRQLLAMATVGGVGVGVGGLAAAGPAQAAGSKAQPGNPGKHEYTLTVIGTTDLPGNLDNCDYFENAEYDDTAHHDIGVAKAATLNRAIRVDVGGGARVARHDDDLGAGWVYDANTVPEDAQIAP